MAGARGRASAREWRGGAGARGRAEAESHLPELAARHAVREARALGKVVEGLLHLQALADHLRADPREQRAQLRLLRAAERGQRPAHRAGGKWRHRSARVPLHVRHHEGLLEVVDERGVLDRARGRPRERRRERGVLLVGEVVEAGDGERGAELVRRDRARAQRVELDEALAQA